MLLTELSCYLVEHRRVPIADLASRFEVEPEALRGMLAMLVAKGRVRRLDTGEICDGCAKCEAYHLEVYEWTGSA
jgi:predicted ArsR family transcriptional regulator